jgi:hypothetical protein
MKNIEIFRKHLDMISVGSVKEFTEFALSNVPDYFWTINASTSGSSHGGETLVEHIQGCLFLAEIVIRQFKGHWTERQNCQLLSALLLHDGWKCGFPGKEERYTKEDIKIKGMSDNYIGKLKSSKEHPEIAYQQVFRLASKFNLNARKNGKKQIGAKNLQPILNSIRYHYGPWTVSKLDKPFCLSWPFDTVVMQVHNIDFMQTHNAVYFGE